MGAERCPTDQADWHVRVLLGRDLLGGETESDEIREFDDYFTGDKPGPEDFLPLPEGWQWILEFTVKPVQNRTV